MSSLSLWLSLRNWLATRNSVEITTVAIVLGRDVVIQKAEASLGLAPHQTLELLPLIISERGLIGDETTLRRDQRYEWWNKWAKENEFSIDLLPETISSPALRELSAEPLLLYIIASTKVYEDAAVSKASRYGIYDLVLRRIISNWHNRAQKRKATFPSDPTLQMIIELVACAAWNDGGRVTTIEKVLELAKDNLEIAQSIDGIVGMQEVFRALLAFYMKLDGQVSSNNVGIEFSHKSFCEFFIARRLIRQMSIAIENAELFRDGGLTLSTSPRGHRGINQVIAGFLANGIAAWPAEARQKTIQLASNTLQHFFGKAGKGKLHSSVADHQGTLAIEIALVALSCLRPSNGEMTVLNWRATNSAREFFELVMAEQNKSDWHWRHAFTSLIPDEFGTCATHLSRLDFGGQNLAGVRFTGLNLFGCSFAGCDLSDAAFVDCIVCAASFAHANLQSSRWHGTNITDANFECSEIDYADFRFANGRTSPQFSTSRGNERAIF